MTCVRREGLARLQAAFGLALLLVGVALGQEPSVATPPPPILFPDWREVGRTEGGTEYALEFPSPAPTGIPANDVVPLRVIRPESPVGPVPVVLVLHYWGAQDLRAERSLAAELNRRGVAAALMTLPYHLSRTPPGSTSGELAIPPDPARIRATMAQATLDARRAIDFLTSRPEFRSDRIGIMGTSLGAVVAALAYAVDSRLSRLAVVLGGTDLAKILGSSSRLVSQREVLRKLGYTEERLRRELLPVEPLSYLPRAAPGEAFVIGARYDTVVPRVSTEELIAALPRASTLWIDTGHYGGIFVQRRVLREVARFFGTEFAGGEYVPPTRIYAPTIRLGVATAAPTGIDLGVGLDVWRSSARGDAFGTLLVTPRGPMFFLGGRVSSGLAIGGFGSSRGLGVGLFWSRVL